MAHRQIIVRMDLDPRQPVQEVVEVVSAMIQANLGREDEILQGVKEAIERVQAQRTKMKGAERDAEPVRQSDAV
ncbi:hypothetical protein [Cohnella sp. GbtcB17]|uniref:hypothetical protein n=1 Tax=Cohnella sp. GbtcB17 TaxID=2824762 RepID=UPI001C305C86|nr:hypothetical protein [Cohnella sp. GbtcB17]